MKTNIILASLILVAPVVVFADNKPSTKPMARMADDAISKSAKEVKEETIGKLNSLLRGEISAVETYRQAIQKVGTHVGKDSLLRYMADHQKAISVLNGEVIRLGGTPSTDSGAWGAWAQTVVGTANLFGDTAALKALKEGEEHGLKEYNEALQNDEIAASVKTMIKEEFIVKQREHIKGLDMFISEAA